MRSVSWACKGMKLNFTRPGARGHRVPGASANSPGWDFPVSLPRRIHSHKRGRRSENCVGMIPHPHAHIINLLSQSNIFQQPMGIRGRYHRSPVTKLVPPRQPTFSGFSGTLRPRDQFGPMDSNRKCNASFQGEGSSKPV